MLSRRAALQRIGALLGAPVCAPAAASFLAGWEQADAALERARSTLSAQQQEALSALVEVIIPTTDTPGAIAAGVDVFIERVLSKLFTEEQRAEFLAGLADTDRRALAQGKAFAGSSLPTQTEVLRKLEAEAAAARASKGKRPAFFDVLKELTLIGYYTSEVGATRELRYVHVAGSYDGDVPFEKVGRAYSD